MHDVTITDCNFGTRSNQDASWFIYNVRGLKLNNVTIGGKKVDTVLST